MVLQEGLGNESLDFTSLLKKISNFLSYMAHAKSSLSPEISEEAEVCGEQYETYAKYATKECDQDLQQDIQDLDDEYQKKIKDRRDERDEKKEIETDEAEESNEEQDEDDYGSGADSDEEEETEDEGADDEDDDEDVDDEDEDDDEDVDEEDEDDGYEEEDGEEKDDEYIYDEEAEKKEDEELPEALDHLKCDNFKEELEKYVSAYERMRSGSRRDHVKDLIGEIKGFSRTCEGYERPARYAKFAKYPYIYHPCTIDGEKWN